MNNPTLDILPYTNFRPTLALDVELEDVIFPCYIQEKYNGVRVEKVNGRALTRTLKPIPNRFIRTVLETPVMFNQTEGEILIHGVTTVNDVTSAVMSEDGQPEFYVRTFDAFDELFLIYALRHRKLFSPENTIVTPIENIICYNLDQLKEFVAQVKARKGEGVIIRYPNYTYKFGRATKGTPSLLRYVLHQQATATIISCEQLFENNSPSYTDELGRQKRQKLQAYQNPLAELGAFLVSCPLFPQPFRVGTGFTKDQRIAYWSIKDTLIGKSLTFEYKPSTVIVVPAPAVFKHLTM